MLKPRVKFQFYYNTIQKGIKNKDLTAMSLNENLFNNELGEDESVNKKELITKNRELTVRKNAANNTSNKKKNDMKKDPNKFSKRKNDKRIKTEVSKMQSKNQSWEIKKANDIFVNDSVVKVEGKDVNKSEVSWL